MRRHFETDPLRCGLYDTTLPVGRRGYLRQLEFSTQIALGRGKNRNTMYGLSFVASLFWASETLRFASAIRLPTSSAKCADAADGPGLGVCVGTGVCAAGEAWAVLEPERIAASFAAISARFCAMRASFCLRVRKAPFAASERKKLRRTSPILSGPLEEVWG